MEIKDKKLIESYENIHEFVRNKPMTEKQHKFIKTFLEKIKNELCLLEFMFEIEDNDYK